MEHILFLTGRLAQPALERVLGGIDNAPFSWEVREIGLQVAALMTADMVKRRVEAPGTLVPRRLGLARAPLHPEGGRRWCPSVSFVPALVSSPPLRS